MNSISPLILIAIIMLGKKSKLLKDYSKGKITEEELKLKNKELFLEFKNSIRISIKICIFPFKLLWKILTFLSSVSFESNDDNPGDENDCTSHDYTFYDPYGLGWKSYATVADKVNSLDESQVTKELRSRGYTIYNSDCSKDELIDAILRED